MVKLLTHDQIAILQQEAGRISSGYRSLSILDESDVEMNEFDLNDEDSVLVNEPIAVVTEPVITSVVRTMKNWWRDNLQ